MNVTFTQYHNCVSTLTNVYLLGHYWRYGIQTWHDSIDLCVAYMLMLVSMVLTLMQGHSGLAEEKNHRWIISKTKQPISIKVAATVSHDKLYFSGLKSSVALVLNYGQTSISCTVHTACACMLSERALAVETKDVIDARH